MTSSSIDLSYIELPVHLRFPLVGAGPIRLNLVLGPTFGINTGCKITTDVATAEACADFANGFEPKKIDVAGAGGLGVSLGLGGIAYAGVDLKYTLGLTSVSEAAATVGDGLKNRAFTLTGHFGFDVF